MLKRIVLVAGLAFALGACNADRTVSSNRHLQPIPAQTVALMERKGMSPSDPIMMRVFKKEAELEIWKQGSDGRYALLDTYPICRWSGQLGPKKREGDRQAPEGFYTVTPDLMNPNSAYYLSFNLGYPNQFDREHGRTGRHLMVHGSCTSAGCFAMTDESVAEIYAIAREAFAGGQRGFQVQSFPFRMTPENLAAKRYDENIAFWRNLKEGHDHFEVTQRPPRVEVCNREYSFNTQGCTPVDNRIAQAVAERQRRDEARIAQLIERGKPAVRLVYQDGGSHPSFTNHAVAFASATDASQLSSRARRLGEVSRPDAIAAGPQVIRVASNGQPLEAAQPRAVAAAPARPTQEPGVSNVARSEPAAGEERPLHQRLFGNLFSRGLFSGEAGDQQAPTAETPLPPQRGAGLMPGAQPLTPRGDAHYTSFR
jgi:murein L,D-transpeptidase YafK